MYWLIISGNQRYLRWMEPEHFTWQIDCQLTWVYVCGHRIGGDKTRQPYILSCAMTDGPMLWIGAPCHTCHREDLLPLLCSKCTKQFCADHFGEHGCTATDYIAPQCPYCGEPPRGWRRGASAAENRAVMDRHYDGECEPLGGMPAKKRMCSYARCSTVLLVPIRVCVKLTSALSAPRTIALRIAHLDSMDALNLVRSMGAKRGHLRTPQRRGSLPRREQKLTCQCTWSMRVQLRCRSLTGVLASVQLASARLQYAQCRSVTTVAS